MSDSPQVKRNLISRITKLVYELSQKLPNDLKLRITELHGIFAAGGGLCPHKKKKQKKQLRIIGS